MECAVYDTYVTKKDGKTMHFDVEASSPHEKAIEYGKEFLNKVGEGTQKKKSANFVTFSKHPQPLRVESKKKDTLFRRWKAVLNPQIVLFLSY
jgi:hypothetical protein